MAFSRGRVGRAVAVTRSSRGLFGGAVVAAVLAGVAHAGLTQSQITSPGGFIQAGAFHSTNGGIVPGGDLSVLQVPGTPGDFEETAFLSSASASAAYVAAPYALDGVAEAGMGFVRTLTTRDSPSGAAFSLGATNGGWKDTWTISAPGLAGQAGTLVCSVRVRGLLDAAGFNGSAAVTFAAFKNNVELALSPYYTVTGGSPSAFQRGQWVLSSFGQPVSLPVDGVVTLGVPITFGQSFTLGVYAFTRAGHRSQGGGGNSTARADLSQFGVTWAGVDSIRNSAGVPVSGATIQTASGINWAGPVGEPCLPDLTATAVPGSPGFGVPNGTLNSEDFFYFIAQYAAGNLAVCDLTTSAGPGSPGYGVPNGVINSEDFFYYLALYAQGC